MQIDNSSLSAQKSFAAIKVYAICLFLIAVINFAQTIYKYDTADFHYGAPVEFFPRLIILVTLFITLIGSFISDFKGRVISLCGIVSAISAYLYWWVSSYNAFKKMAQVGINFLTSQEVNQVGYLYEGNWLDIILAAVIFVALVLETNKLTKTASSIK